MPVSKVDLVRKKLDDVRKFLEPYKSLVNAHMTSFITEKYWVNLPHNIKEDFYSMSLDKFHEKFWSSGKSVGATQEHSTVEKFFHDCWHISLASDAYSDMMLPALVQEEGSKFRGKCMSPKKTHEVSKLREVVTYLTERSLATCVVDVGGGKGYLGASLVLEKNINVLSIDSKPLNTTGAAHIFERLERQMSSPRNTSPLYKQVTALVTFETDLSAIAKLNFELTSDHRMCLTGLHVCGDLASTCIQLFCKNKSILSMCTIGCCYNLLTEKFEPNHSSKSVSDSRIGFGFPLSGLLCQLQYNLGRNARMIACQPIERIYHEKRAMTSNLFWRAVLQVHLEHLFGIGCEISIGRACSKAKNLSEYFYKAEKASTRDLKLSEEKIQELTVETQQYFDIMAKFYCLRLALAPVVETLLVLDKLLHVYEQGIDNAYISKVFDGVESPRCYAIIAFK